jgi:Holliday junction resolvasome RuvABC endonuclease subunit
MARKKKKKKAQKTRADILNIVKQPSVLSDKLLLEPKKYKHALGLDLGTRTGFAFLQYTPDKLPSRAVPYIGQFDLQVGGWETMAMKFVRLKQFLNVLVPDVIFFEDVKQRPRANNMHMMGGIIRSVEMLGCLKAIIMTWAEENGIPAHGFPIAEIKKHASGRGNANKESMILACNAKFATTYDHETYENTGVDNEADAAFVLDLGMEVYCEGLK